MKKVLFIAGVIAISFLAAVYWLSDTCDTSVCQLSEVMPIVGRLQDEHSLKKQNQVSVIQGGKDFRVGYVESGGRYLFVLKNDAVLLVEPKPNNSSLHSTWRCDLFPQVSNAKGLLDDCGTKFRLSK